MPYAVMLAVMLFHMAAARNVTVHGNYSRTTTTVGHQSHHTPAHSVTLLSGSLSASASHSTSSAGPASFPYPVVHSWELLCPNPEQTVFCYTEGAYCDDQGQMHTDSMQTSDEKSYCQECVCLPESPAYHSATEAALGSDSSTSHTSASHTSERHTSASHTGITTVTPSDMPPWLATVTNGESSYGHVPPRPSPNPSPPTTSSPGTPTRTPGSHTTSAPSSSIDAFTVLASSWRSSWLQCLLTATYPDPFWVCGGDNPYLFSHVLPHHTTVTLPSSYGNPSTTSEPHVTAVTVVTSAILTETVQPRNLIEEELSCLGTATNTGDCNGPLMVRSNAWPWGGLPLTTEPAVTAVTVVTSAILTETVQPLDDPYTSSTTTVPHFSLPAGWTVSSYSHSISSSSKSRSSMTTIPQISPFPGWTISYESRSRTTHSHTRHFNTSSAIPAPTSHPSGGSINFTSPSSTANKTSHKHTRFSVTWSPSLTAVSIDEITPSPTHHFTITPLSEASSVVSIVESVLSSELECLRTADNYLSCLGIFTLNPARDVPTSVIESQLACLQTATNADDCIPEVHITASVEGLHSATVIPAPTSLASEIASTLSAELDCLKTATDARDCAPGYPTASAVAKRGILGPLFALFKPRATPAPSVQEIGAPDHFQCLRTASHIADCVSVPNWDRHNRSPVTTSAEPVMQTLSPSTGPFNTSGTISWLKCFDQREGPCGYQGTTCNALTVQGPEVWCLQNCYCVEQAPEATTSVSSVESPSVTDGPTPTTLQSVVLAKRGPSRKFPYDPYTGRGPLWNSYRISCDPSRREYVCVEKFFARCSDDGKITSESKLCDTTCKCQDINH